MRQRNSKLELAASDLANHLACKHLSELERRVARGELSRPSWTDPALELLVQRGIEHEKAFVESLRAAGRRVVDLSGVKDRDEAARRTHEAARVGVEVIVQAALVDGRWNGRADILERVEEPSALRAWSYDVLDTKLAQETRGGTVLQLCLYADLLATVQGRRAQRMFVVKPGPGFPREEFRFADYEAYYRLVKNGLVEFVDRAERVEPYPEPVPHCDICRWWARGDERRHRDDHLSLVAGMPGLHAGELRRQGVATLAALARARPLLREEPQRGHREAFEKLQAQAAVQLRGRDEKRPVSQRLPFEPGRGLARLPEPDEGDVFLDFEGDPFVPAEGDGTAGLEYLLGYAFIDEKGASRYVPLWGLDRAAEKRAFEAFVDFVLARLERHPGLHVYHYASYEPAALKRLASRHASRERELDVLLRGERFVDLYAVTRQGLLASVESYSLKPLEEFFGYRRVVKLREEASPALQRVGCALELGAPESILPADRDAVAGYNRDDCLSLVELRRWLEEQRAALAAGGAPVERPPLKDGSASEKGEELGAELQELFDALVAGVPADPKIRTDEEQARWLLAHLIEYFHREDRVAWWEYFARRELDDEELRKDRKALVGLEPVAELPKQGKEQTPVHRYRFEPQEVSFDAGDEVCDPRVEISTEPGGEREDDKVGTVRALDLVNRLIDVKKTRKWAKTHPTALHLFERVPPKPLDTALHALARWVAEHGLGSPRPEHRAARDLLLALPPRTRPPLAGALQQAGEDPLAAARRVALALDGGVLAIQGPPGSGKTHNGARLILALARAGKRIGVSATSHKVIRNLLEEALDAADEAKLELHVTHKISSRSPAPTDLRPRYHVSVQQEAALTDLGRGHVVGGVAWLWADEGASGQLDYLVIDEAGQMSLAQVLASAQAARNLILLGDPQQLQQPQRGAHPEGSEVSALSHLLRGAPTIPPDRGLFLAETWRLAPPLCAFTSELFYAGRLRSRAGCELQRLAGPTRFSGAGLFLVEVRHEGNQSSAPEEVEAIERIVADLVRPGVSWTDRKGKTRSLTREDLLVIAPYNAQVAALSRSPALAGLAIGTVDLFQGQERPVVLYSLTSSTPLDAPRGLAFLYDLHRLNVATSRARCACIVVASPALFEPECHTPEQMRLANGLCSLAERSMRIALGP